MSICVQRNSSLKNDISQPKLSIPFGIYCAGHKNPTCDIYNDLKMLLYAM